MPASPPSAAPSWSEIAAMMAAMGGHAAPAPPPPPPERDTGPMKWVLGVLASLVVVFLGGLGTYAGSTIAGVGTIGPKLDNLTSRFEDVKKSVDGLNQQSNQQQLQISNQGLRLTTVEQNQARLMDRMRAVEGGARLNAPALGSVPAAP